MEVRAGDGANSKRATSTTSRSSELFDSLDLSVSARLNGDVLTRIGGRSGSNVVAATPATAQSVFTTGAVAHPTPQARENEDAENAQSLNSAIIHPTVVTAVVSRTHTPSGGLTGVAAVSPCRDGPPEKTTPEATTAGFGSQVRYESKGAAAKPSRPERHLEGSPTALPKAKATPSDPSGDSKVAPGESRGVSRLRAPGWGREASICSIPPASNVAEVPKFNLVPVKTARDAGAAPTATALLPWDLLTPVTEVATVDERSVASHSTRGAAMITPASSVASGCIPDQGEALRAVRERSRHRDSHHLQADSLRRAVAAPGTCKQKAHAQTSECGDGRSPIHRDNKTVWDISTAGSGPRSAQGQRSVPWTGRSSPGGGPLSSVSAYRASPIRGTSDGVENRGSNLSSAVGERAPARQASGGYIAAMGRRARSVARRDVARRSAAAAMAANRARPSTPISERARWGKGRESQEDAKALAERRSVATATTTTLLPADPRHVRACAGSGAPTTHQHGGPNCAEKSTRCRTGEFVTGMETDAIREAACVGSIPDRRNKTPHLLVGTSEDSPACFGHSHGSYSGEQSSVGRAIADGSAACIRQKSETQAAPQGRSPVGEEERLIASIARLDTLLREENG
ncbi:unnamed protein product, partial [Hapterophycus canaliculatus]